MEIRLYGTYIIGEETVMCIGMDLESECIVFAPFYSDSEDGSPEIHVEDGVKVVNVGDIDPDTNPISPYKYEPKFRLTAELIGFNKER